MLKKIYTLALLAAMVAPASIAMAQESADLLAGKPVFTLGPAKTWTSTNGDTFTMDASLLEKLTAVPQNTSNIYLFPEVNGPWDTPENRELGIQGFYVDMEKVQTVSTVTTTWEGAAANSYNIYLTTDVPTLDILDSTPTYSATGLGQYHSNTASLPEKSRGRYLVFQPTDATNWGWGVKIQSISATGVYEAELTQISVSPSIVLRGEPNDMSIVAYDQFGLEIDPSEYEVSVAGDATYEDGKLTVVSGEYATVIVKYGDKELQQRVYAVPAPPVPAMAAIKYPIFSNGNTENNDIAFLSTKYNGGADRLGIFEFSNGTVAEGFENTRCVFFSQNNDDFMAFNPAANGYRSLCVDIFSADAVEGEINFETVNSPDGSVKPVNPFTLKADQWNHIEVNVKGAEDLHVASVRFSAENAPTILLANIYFTPVYIEGDTEAPVLESVTADPANTSVTLQMKATDDLNPSITYYIIDGDKRYTAYGNSGEMTEYTIEGLEVGSLYSFGVIASDGLNESDQMNVEVRTTGVPDAPTPTWDKTLVDPIYSAYYEEETIPTFDAEGSNAEMTTFTTESGSTLLQFKNFAGEKAQLVNLNKNVFVMTTLHLDIYGLQDGQLTIKPIWKDAEAAGQTTPGIQVNVNANEWNSYNLLLTDFGFNAYGNDITALEISNTPSLARNTPLNNFYMDNLYFYQDSATGVDHVEAAEKVVTVYNLQGVCVARNISVEELATLPAGMYGVSNGQTTKKVMIK